MTELFGNITWSFWDLVILIGAVVIVEWPIKTWICKKDEKYKLIYTYAPVVLCVVAYVVLSFINKTPILSNLLQGVGVGFAAMGSYDAILSKIKTGGAKGIKELTDGVKEVVEGK